MVLGLKRKETLVYRDLKNLGHQKKWLKRIIFGEKTKCTQPSIKCSSDEKLVGHNVCPRHIRGAGELVGHIRGA